METSGADVHKLNPHLPFRLRLHMEGLNSRSDRAQEYKLVLLEQGSMTYTSAAACIINAAPVLYIIPPGKTYALKPQTSSRGVQLVFSREFLDQLLLLCWKQGQIRHFIGQLWQTAGPALPDPVRLHPQQAGEVRELFRELEQEYTQQSVGWELLSLQLILRLFVSLYRDRPMPTKPPPALWQIDDLIAYIQENYAADFSLAAMAEKYSFSPSYFSRRFKEKTGMPLFEYINTIRIQKACLLLKRSRESIIEIAFAVGYNNLSFFNRYFRKIMHLSPREYRNHVQR